VRTGIRFAFALLVVVGLMAACGRQDAGSTGARGWLELAGDLPPERTNVVLVTLDTLRADRLSSYGSRRVSTPAIDRLADEGVLFTNAASTVPFTLPAHSSLMTGTYPPRHGVRENVGYVLDKSLPTLAERLAAGGWSTAGFVSAFVLDSRWGIGRGFETYFDEFETEEGQRANMGSVQRDGAETVAEAVRWLDERPAGPFFLWLHLFDAHDPYRPPEPFKSRYPRSPYDAEVAYVDSLVGRFRAALEERGLLDETLLVLTADHGEGLGQHKEGFHGFFVYDSTVRVPLIVRPPFAELAGRVVEAPVSHVDLLPTILDATGQPHPDALQGVSLLPLLLGDVDETSSDRVVYSESLYPLLHYGWAPLRSVRTRDFKFIDAPQAELYSLAGDPGETENVLRREPQVSRDLKARLDELRERIEIDAPAETAEPELDEETLAQLQALGYAAGSGGVSLEEEGERPRADPKDRIELHQLIMAAQSDIGAENPERAEERLRRAIAEDPTILEGHQMLGEVAARAERWEEAAEHFQQALALEESHEPALFGLARTYQKLGRSEDALVGFRRLAELDPQATRPAMAMADVLLAEGRRDEAIAELERVAGVEEAPVLLLNRLGELLVEEGRTGAAEELFQRAIRSETELGQPYYNLAVLREESGDAVGAMTLYHQALERAPSHYQAQFNLGRLHGALGQLDEQQRLYEAAIASNEEFVRGYYFLAKLLLDRGGDLARAEELTRQGLEKDPDGVRAGPLGYYVLADILNRQRRSAEAARAAETGRRIQAEGSSPS
jgi:arylsulfatase A-like enzyme/Tfp pilus assembly protein PilF